MKIKNYLTIICIITGVNLYSQDIIDEESNKKDKIYIRNNTNLFMAYEEQIHRSIFRSYSSNGDQKVNNIQFGFLYNFKDSNFSVESRFQELRKGNYSDYQNTCFSRNCFLITNQIGSYMRNEFVGNGLYDIFDDILYFKLGARYVKSELSNSVRFNFTDRFSQRFIGGNVGIKLKTPTFYNLFLTVDLEAFYGRGRINHKYANTFPRGFNDYTFSDENPSASFQGEEVDIMLNYNLGSKFYFGVGLGWINSRIKPSEMKVNTTDFERDFEKNIQFDIFGGKSFSDSFYRTTFELGFYF